MVFSLQVLRLEFCMNFHLSHACYMNHLIVLDPIILYDEAPHFAFFSILLLFPLS